MKNIILLLTFILISFAAFLISCSKGGTETPAPTPTPGLVGNFTVQITNRLANEVTISWTQPTIPPGSVLQFKVYLSGNLQAQNISGSSYTIINLVANQGYTATVVAYISATESSTTSFTIPAFVPGNPADSVYILSRVTDAGGLQLAFDYDINNKRLNSWSKTYSSFNYDSTKIFYNASGQVISLVKKATSSTPFVVIPNVFEYDGQGRVSKVYHKTLYSTNQSYAYMTTVNFPLDFLYELDSYDSLNYDALNRVKSVYSFTSFNGNRTVPGFYTKYKIFSYTATNDSLLSKMDTYTRNLSNTFDLSTLNFTGYNNKANPYYLLFRKFYLMGVENFITFPTFLPYYYYPYSLNAILTNNPYLCTDFNSSSFLTYSYNSNGLVSTVIKGADWSEWVNFSYAQVKK